MKIQRDQIIQPMKKISDEYEYTQNPVAREFLKENTNDCLHPRSMIQERMKEQTSVQENTQDTPILDSKAGVDDSNLEVIDFQIQSKCSNFETQDNKEHIRKISIPYRRNKRTKSPGHPCDTYHTKENDPIFQINVVDDPQEVQVINELNRDLKANDSQDYICAEFLILDSAIHEETKDSSLENSVELSLNVNPKKDPSPQE
ncbi:hypothetical protein AMTRI_Chr11g153680 [Amborella trichopoda]